jgi:AcrR family transcriptional regulator
MTSLPITKHINPNDIVHHDDGQDRHDTAAKDSRQRILDETIAAIDAGGESSVRLTQVSRRAGVTQGLIAYHFGDRESLVSEAQATRFSEVNDMLLSRLEDASERARSSEELTDLLHELIESILTTEASLERERRVSALAATLTRPESRELVSTRLRKLHRLIESVVSRGQTLGIMRADLDPMAVSALISTVSLGCVAVDLDSEHLQPHQAAAIRSQMVMVILDGLALSGHVASLGHSS